VSDIIIRRVHGLAPNKARAAAEKLAHDLEAEYALRWHWEGEVLRFQRLGVNGHLALRRHEVELHARLGFLLLALRGRIEREIDDNFDRYFGKSAGPLV
jgi:putative polyhydroxyalkanoate system protein